MAAVSSSPTSSDTAGAGSSVQAGTGPKGLLLGSYTLTLPRDGGAPLGPTAPTQAQVLAHSGTFDNAGRDVVWDTEYGGVPLATGTGDQMLSLPNGTTPTYQACSADTLASDSESSDPGTAYCILETTGDMVGVTVKSVTVESPDNIVLDVVVWQN